MTSLEEQFKKFESENPRKHGTVTWVEEALNEEQRDFIVTLRKRGKSPGYLADFLREGMGKKDATPGKVRSYLNKAGVK